MDRFIGVFFENSLYSHIRFKKSRNVSKMEDKIQSHRQPLVTATGIILGFILNFAATFVKSDSGLSDSMAYMIAICILIGIVCLIIVLGRVLKMNYPIEKAELYYQTTLNFFLFGISISFIGVMVDMFANFMMD